MGKIIGICPQRWKDTGVWNLLAALEDIAPFYRFTCAGSAASRGVDSEPGDLWIGPGIDMERAIDEAKEAKIRLGILYCSDVLQASLVPKFKEKGIPVPVGDLEPLYYYLRLMETHDFIYLICTSERLVNLLKCTNYHLSERIFYLPVFGDENKFWVVPRSFPSNNVVGLLGTMDLHRNLAVQVAAIAHTWKRLGSSRDLFSVMINGDEKKRVVNFFERLFYLPDNMFYIVPRLPWAEFRMRLSTLKCGLLVSLSETFCYFAWELGMMGIPSIVSKTVDWYRTSKMELFEGKDSLLSSPGVKDIVSYFCVVDRVDDYTEIGDKLEALLTMDDRNYGVLSREVIRICKEENGRRKKLALKILNQLRGGGE